MRTSGSNGTKNGDGHLAHSTQNEFKELLRRAEAAAGVGADEDSLEKAAVNTVCQYRREYFGAFASISVNP